MAIPKKCKGLAEVDFPIAVISRYAAPKKSRRRVDLSMVSLLRSDLPQSEKHPDTQWEAGLQHLRERSWLYVIMEYDTRPRSQLIKDPASLAWPEVKKVDHYWMTVDAMREPMRVREDRPGGERHEES